MKIPKYRNRILRGVIFLLIAGLVALSTWKIAKAYNIEKTWATESATYRFHSSLLPTFQSSVNFGAQVWNQVITSSWTWVYSSGSPNDIMYGNIDGPGNKVAQTSRTSVGNTIVEADIKFDAAESWYTGSDTPGPTQYDARSTAAHEFGHALGLGHPSEGSAACPTPGNNTSRATMCNGAVPGTTFKRSLANDDKNGVSAAYPSVLSDTNNK